MAIFPRGFIHRQFIYTPPVPTASFKGKTVIITGSNAGLGLEAARWIVNLSAIRVILACRNVEKGHAAAGDIRASTRCPEDTIEVWKLDMSSYASVLAFADRVITELPRLDVLIGNAGIVAGVFRLAEDNEETITVNVVSLALLGCLLIPKLRETAAACKTQTYFTVTSSEMYEVAKFKERKAPVGQLFATLSDEKKTDMWDRYNVSKLLTIFVVKQMAAMLPLGSNNVIMNCVAPGFCHSGLGERDHGGLATRAFKKMFARPTEIGARTLVYGASAGPKSHGQYVPDCKITPTIGLTRGNEGAELQQRVWAELREKLEAVRPGVTSLS